MVAKRALIALVLMLTACGGSPAATGASAATSPESSTGAELTAEQKTWCTNHTGGPGDDQHQVEDAALSLGVIAGAKTREDVFGRWGGKTAADLYQDQTYQEACIAAFVARESPSPSG